MRISQIGKKCNHFLSHQKMMIDRDQTWPRFFRNLLESGGKSDSVKLPHDEIGPLPRPALFIADFQSWALIVTEAPQAKQQPN